MSPLYEWYRAKWLLIAPTFISGAFYSSLLPFFLLPRSPSPPPVSLRTSLRERRDSIVRKSRGIYFPLQMQKRARHHLSTEPQWIITGLRPFICKRPVFSGELQLLLGNCKHVNNTPLSVWHGVSVSLFHDILWLTGEVHIMALYYLHVYFANNVSQETLWYLTKVMEFCQNQTLTNRELEKELAFRINTLYQFD